MVIEDIPDVLKVELSSFTIPWPKEAFEREIAMNQYAHYYAAEYNGRLIGYCGMWVVYDQVQITNIAILPEFRGNGFGGELLGFVIKKAREYGGSVLSLEVRVSNTAAMTLYKKFGLQPGGIRKQYYTDNQEDALVMWVNL
jgi:ribosomal-protein-alanine N-acetyltransferase